MEIFIKIFCYLILFINFARAILLIVSDVLLALIVGGKNRKGVCCVFFCSTENSELSK